MKLGAKNTIVNITTNNCQTTSSLKTGSSSSSAGVLTGFSFERSKEAPHVHNQAAITIARNMRAHIAKKAEKQMLNQGAMWKKCQKALIDAGKLKPGEDLSLAKVSSINMSTLRQKMGKLTEKEAEFFVRFTQQKFFATHFTDAELDNDASQGGRILAMFSREKLDLAKIEFNRFNTVLDDMAVKADNNVVFFSMECGERPKKLYSRFGKNLYRVSLDSPAFMQVSWSSLHDLLMGEAKVKHVKRHIPGLSAADAKAINKLVGMGVRNLASEEGYSDIFAGKDMVPGAALSIILQLRKLQANLPSKSGALPPLIERLLASSTEDEFNGLLNTFFRPEIRVPIHFFSTDFRKFTDKELAKMKKDPAYHWQEPSALEKLENASGSQAWKNSVQTEDADEAQTVLMQEAIKGDAAKVEILLKEGANLEARDESGNTALMLAVEAKQFNIMKILVKAGANLEARDAAGNNALMLAVLANDIRGVEFLINAGANIRARRDVDGTSALKWAARRRNIEIMKLLIKEGADKNDQLDSLKTLLEKSPNSEEAIKAAKAMLAADIDGIDALLYFAEKSTMHRAFNAALGISSDVVFNRKKFMKYLLQAGADGAGAMLKLAQSGATSRLSRLVDAGADKIKNEQGETALMQAVKMVASNQESVSEAGLQALKALIKAGADITIRDNGGKTAKDHADELATNSGNEKALLVFTEVAATASKKKSISIFRK